jgi:hypothetical protein
VHVLMRVGVGGGYAPIARERKLTLEFSADLGEQAAAAITAEGGHDQAACRKLKVAFFIREVGHIAARGYGLSERQ